MKLVSSAENSSLDWKAQYQYIEDIGDGRGYTAGIIGFCSGTGDMLDLVQLYTDRKPGNVLAKYLPGAAPGERHRLARRPRPELPQGLAQGGPGQRRSSRRRTTSATASTSTRPSSRARRTGCGALGQFAYYDAIVMHGDGDDATSFRNIRKRALRSAKPPAQGGDEVDVPERLPRRARVGHEAGGGPQRHQPGRHGAAGVPAQRQPRPEHAAELEGVRGQLPHRLSFGRAAVPPPARYGGPPLYGRRPMRSTTPASSRPRISWYQPTCRHSPLIFFALLPFNRRPR